MKRTIFVMAGFCWFLFALVFVFLLVMYLAAGAGLGLLGLGLSSGSILSGWAHVVGLIMASVVCFAIGAGLCLHGWLFCGPEDPRRKR